MASNCHSINKVKINFKVTTLIMKYQGRRHRSLVLMKPLGSDPWQVLGPWWAPCSHGWSPDVSAPDKVWSSAALDLSWAGLWFSLQLKYGTADQTDSHHPNFQASFLPLIYPGLLVLGLSCGLSNPLSAIYITEIAGMANKGIVTSMFNFNLTFGILLTNVVGSLAG